jgi:hypothetical protein
MSIYYGGLDLMTGGFFPAGVNTVVCCLDLRACLYVYSDETSSDEHAYTLQRQHSLLSAPVFRKRTFARGECVMQALQSLQQYMNVSESITI